MGTNSKQSKKLQAPKGTRDLYPPDVLKRRYIQNAWRDASLRCGFDEIEGPTFETTHLYSIKSGEGILGELFQAFSGKGGQETLDKLVEKGQADFALRPEFTPTLARMYAARSKELSKPCKWFTAGPYFRAERPQRGRLREFLQWNVDVIGLPGEGETPEAKALADAETIECAVSLLANLGFNANDCQIHFSHREAVSEWLLGKGVTVARLHEAFALLDKYDKLSETKASSEASALGLDIHDLRMMKNGVLKLDHALNQSSAPNDQHWSEGVRLVPGQMSHLLDSLDRPQMSKWISFDLSIVRGLAYYTGTVFEALADGERAVAGGGRYDNLIELMGGPPTPAVGFAMGDVVLGNLLEDKGLMPEGIELMEAVSRPQTSIRPVAFVVPSGDDDNEPLVHTLVANLRRGIESEEWLSRDDRKPWQSDRYAIAPMHARVSYKSTRKVGKLRDDAQKQHARFFVVIHAEDKVEVTDMDTRESLGSFSADPASANYAGRAIAKRM